MENYQEKSIFELNLTEEAKSNFSSIAQWALINSIVAFASLGVGVLGVVLQRDTPGRSGQFLGLLITIAISLLLNLTLLSAANNIKKGLATTDQGFFNTGLSKLTTYFKIFGILMIIVLVICVLFMLIILAVGSSTATRL